MASNQTKIDSNHDRHKIHRDESAIFHERR